MRKVRARHPLATTAPIVLAILLSVPVACGVAGVLLPALGYHPGLSMELPQVIMADGSALHRLFVPLHYVMFAPAMETSVMLAIAVGMIATVVSLLITFTMIAYMHRRMVLVQTLLSPVLAMPHVAIAVGLVFVFAPSGWGARIDTFLFGEEAKMFQWLWTAPDASGISTIFVLIIKETAFLLFVALAALNRPQMLAHEKIARSLGYTASSAFWRILSPEVYARLRLGVLAVLCYGVSQVEISAVTSTNLPPALGGRVLQWYDDADLLNQYVAAAAAALQIGVIGLVVCIWTLAGKGVHAVHRRWACRVAPFWQGHAVETLTPAQHPDERPAHTHWRFLLSEKVPIWITKTAFVSLMLLAFVSSLAMLVWSVTRRWSYPNLLPTKWSARNWLDSEIWQLAATTLFIGVVATLLALVVVVTFLEAETYAKRRWHRFLAASFFVPMFFPPVSLVFGWQVFLLTFDLQQSPLINVCLGHALVVLPYVYLSLATPWRRLPIQHRQAGLSLGHRPWRIFFAVVIPQSWTIIFGAAAIGFAVSVAQYVPTLVLGSGSVSTLTTEAVALSSGGNRRVLGVVAVLQSVLPWIAFFLAFTLPLLLGYRKHRRAIWHAGDSGGRARHIQRVRAALWRRPFFGGAVKR